MFLWQVLVVPFLMTVTGLLMRTGGPKDIKWWVGYRTPMSTKNKDTWVFAHRYCGRLWTKLGLICVILSIGVMILGEGNIFTLDTLPWILGAQVVIVVLSIIPTEIALRKAFDRNGMHR